MSQHNEEKFYQGPEAARYLAKRWGRESYSSGAFRALCFRLKINADLESHAATFWKQSTLDSIPRPDRHNPRPKRKRVAQEASAEAEHDDNGEEKQGGSPMTPSKWAASPSRFTSDSPHACLMKV